MPRRDDLDSILVFGSGPIVIGQACEFDYSGTQACRALRREGYRVVLVNSNPATIMTDPEIADATYVEPLVPRVVEKILEAERPDAVLPTVGGQTGINLAQALDRRGAFERFGRDGRPIELLGASIDALELGESRQRFKEAMLEIGLDVPQSAVVSSQEQARAAAERLGFPLIVRPSFTLGGEGGGTAASAEELHEILETAFHASPTHEALVEQSVVGWKEYELEVIRDQADNAIIVCSVENFDAMGVHTGDSITVAPQQTLSDVEYQAMRDEAFQVIRRVGVATGGSNIQFAVDPATGRRVVIEMNPRVSRSSALASKATGFPIAKVAALLAVGYTLDELPNDITGGRTVAAFEPSLDYTVVKIPRWAFEKFPQSSPRLGTSMKSVGEVMAIGGTFREALMKGLAALELDGSEERRSRRMADSSRLRRRLAEPNWERLFAVLEALRQDWTVEQIHEISHIDRWFLRELESLVALERELAELAGECRRTAPEIDDDLLLAALDPALAREAKEAGLSDMAMARHLGVEPAALGRRLAALDVRRVYKRVDTCAAEFPATTPYLYSTYGDEDEAEPTDRRKVLILGSGPNRIGQGIEFDYCCVHAAFALRERGFETLMVNCNPETVSTDYDTSDRLYFEPLTLEHVLAVCRHEKPDGVIVQLGGQTPLKLARGLAAAGVSIWGTPPERIDLAEDRRRFGELLAEEGILQPMGGTATSREEALEVARRIGFPVVVRPSYVLGGRAMAVVYDEETLDRYMDEAADVSEGSPVLIDQFLDDAFELDLDLICDGQRAVVCGILQHIEEAGIHSGDSAAVLPPYRVGPFDLDQMRDIAERLALRLGVVGLMNVQFAIHEGGIYVIEANPRASRTVPFVAKAVGVPLVALAARVMAGETLDALGFTREPRVPGVFVKMPVFPFRRFPGVDPLLGPEMKSTGEVMGAARRRFGAAFAKAWLGAGMDLPIEGTVFLSVNDRDKRALVAVARKLLRQGFRLIATGGTAEHLRNHGLDVETVWKVHEGHPNVVDEIAGGRVQLVVNTPLGRASHLDDTSIRTTALKFGVPCVTTLSGAMAAVEGIIALANEDLRVRSLQDYARIA